MGLDIIHNKATLKKPSPDTVGYFCNDDLVIEEEFDSFNVPFGHFEKYIQQVEYVVIERTIVVVQNKKFLAAAKSRFNDIEYFVIAPKTNEEEQEQIHTYIHQEGLGFLEEYHREPSSQEVQWKFVELYRIDHKTGFYTHDVGHQRKGVNGRFWERFNVDNIYCFALQEDFEYAYSCVDFYWQSDTKEDVRERKRLFKENFVDTFELGASYLYLSY